MNFNWFDVFHFVNPESASVCSTLYDGHKLVNAICDQSIQHHIWKAIHAERNTREMSVPFDCHGYKNMCVKLIAEIHVAIGSYENKSEEQESDMHIASGH